MSCDKHKEFREKGGERDREKDREMKRWGRPMLGKWSQRLWDFSKSWLATLRMRRLPTTPLS